ncbi:type I toxin-antitoxin system toxin Ldr family protein [Escherichia coli]
MTLAELGMAFWHDRAGHGLLA